MRLRVLGRDQRLSAERGHAHVCLLCGEDETLWRESLISLDVETDVGVAIVLLVADRAGAEVAAADMAEIDRELWLLDTSDDGVAAGVNFVAAAAPQADLALIWAGVRVGSQWLERMRAAACSDTTVISASALSSRGALLGVDVSGLPLPGGPVRRADPWAAAQAVADLARRAYPRISRLAGPCVYVRREAFELVGFLGEGEELDRALMAFGARTLERGMLHVAADDVYVTVTGASHADLPPSDSAESEPRAWLTDPAEVDMHDEKGVLRGCLTTAQVALDGLSVTLDARALGPGLGGTQVYTVELALALARLGGMVLRVIVAPDLPPEVAQALTQEPAIELVPYEVAASGELPRSHVVHRPQQVFSEDDVNLLRLVGERIVISHQDLIAYRNPGYHADLDDWQRYRRVTRMALATADRAVFFSRHALLDAVEEGLIYSDRAVETSIGGDQLWSRRRDHPVRPDGAPIDMPFLLCLGADYRHKNRPFAIALIEALRGLGWSGCLVFAGPHVAYGSSAGEERLRLSADPELAAAVRDCGPVNEAGRVWLMERTSAVLYPSLYEGFGLLPFEAARAGVPCLYAAQAALAETAGAAAATLVPWDPVASARELLPLLEHGPARDAHVALLHDAARRRSWSEVARSLREVYEQAVASPHRTASARVWEELQRERHLRELSDAASGLGIQLRSLQDSVGMLAGRDHGGVLSENERRGLLRVASRPLTRRALLGPISLLGRRW